MLPEETTEPSRRAANTPTSGSHAVEEESITNAPAAATDGASSGPSLPSGPPSARGEEERIDIPGTHVPAWVVVALILGVIALLGGAAVLLLH